MRFQRSLGYLLVLCAALVAPPASAQAQDAKAVAQQLVQRCGISVQLRGFTNQFAAQFAQQRGQLPDALIIELTNAAKEAFRPDVLEQDIVEGIAKKLKVDEMNGAIAWLETDIGRRVTQAEELSAGTMDETTLRKYAESLKDGKVPDARIKLLGEIIAATYAGDSMVGSLEAIALGVALGMDSTQPVQNRVGMVRLRAQIRAAMPPEQLKQQMSLVLPGIFAYTYRDVSDADLAAYVAFLQGAVGKRYSEQVTETFMEALIRASVRLGQLVDIHSTKRPA